MDIFFLLEELQGIARTGLNYAENEYDRERYQHLLNIAARSYADLLEIPQNEIQERFRQELGSITPKVGADAAIFNQRGEILLMERIDGTGWCLPCGWVEPNERPVDTAIRETREETGLEVEFRQLVGVFTRMPNAVSGPHTTIAVVHLCEVIRGELRLSHEGLDLRYWSVEQVKTWHPNHDKYASAAYRMWASDRRLPSLSD
ncbi:MAG: NUDIX hydrolase N-terminal domain-containing protein [Anaerolineales bacterium]|nr:NUDIX hydrolase N-terminal domain-containing protein [Anaerolineales bacterium]